MFLPDSSKKFIVRVPSDAARAAVGGRTPPVYAALQYRAPAAGFRGGARVSGGMVAREAPKGCDRTAAVIIMHGFDPTTLTHLAEPSSGRASPLSAPKGGEGAEPTDGDVCMSHSLYLVRYGSGGFQGRLWRAFSRSLADLLGLRIVT